MALSPIVQIVHYSDMHIRTRAALPWLHHLRKIAPRLAREWEQGLCGADPFALDAFEQFLGGQVRNDPAWRSVPLWLVDTGDATTFGDDASLGLWLHWTRRFIGAAATSGGPVRYALIYGNHDAWPQTHPLLNRHGMAAQRDELRRHWFQEVYPDDPLTVQIPGTPGCEVQLYRANSVDHALLPSVLATGLAAPDRWWEPTPPMVGPSAADDLGRKAQAVSQAVNGAGHLRILAMHYPVADAAQGSGAKVSRVLRNRGQFARDLQSARHVQPPVAHLVLSGHTHEPFPRLGGLAASASGSSRSPLSPHQSQWVTASLSQVALQGAAAASSTDFSDRMLHNFPHQATVLRLLADPARPGRVVVERGIAGHDAGLPFDYLDTDPNSGCKWEQLEVAY